MQFFKDIFYLFYPNLCINCDNSLLQSETYLCLDCNNKLPIINSIDYKNIASTTFYGKAVVKNVTSFLYFQKDGITQKIIHQLKYKNQIELGMFIGKWFGYKLKESTIFKDVDYLIPVPLHNSKLKKRGYNQLTMFGEALSEILNVEYKTDVLVKTCIAKTQTFKQRFERFANNKTKFNLTDLHVFENKHVLLIDDVITTGATLVSCSNELSKTKNITISIATMAYTKKG